MNPDTNLFEPVTVPGPQALDQELRRLATGGWPTFTIGEVINLRNYRWRVVRCRKRRLTLEAVSPLGPDDVAGPGAGDSESPGSR